MPAHAAGHGEGHERHGHRPDERGAADPQLAGDVETADPLRRPRAGDEHHDRHAERRSGRDTEHERVGQRVAEDRLHLRAAQRRGRRRRDRPRPCAGCAPCGRCRGRLRWPGRAAAGRRTPRPATGEPIRGPTRRRRRRAAAPVSAANTTTCRRGGARRGCGDGDYDGGTSLRNTNSWSGTRSGWSTAT